MGPEVQSRYFAAPAFNEFAKAANPLFLEFDRISAAITPVIDQVENNSAPTTRSRRKSTS